MMDDGTRADSGDLKSQSGLPEHYRVSRKLVGSGPLRELGEAGQDAVALAHWRVGPVDRVKHVNNAHPTILFHAAGGPVESEQSNRFQGTGRSWPGEAMLIPVGAEVNCRWREPVEYLHVYFRAGYVEEVALATDGRLIADLDDRSHVRTLPLNRRFKHLLEAHWPKSADPLLLEGLAIELATEALNTFSTEPMRRVGLVDRAMTPARLRRVLERIESGLDSRLSVSDLAEAAGLSPSHFSRAFRKEVGCSPYRFVMQRRVQRAKHLMEKGSVPLPEIVRQAGFCNAGHLSNTFRQLTGLAPKRWRQMLSVTG